jgi:hypothetical protein
MTISLAFLAPREAAIEGRLPRGIGITRLRDARFVDLIRRRSAKEVQHYGGSTDAALEHLATPVSFLAGHFRACVRFSGSG